MIARNFLSVSLARVMIETMRSRVGAVLSADFPTGGYCVRYAKTMVCCMVLFPSD